jgi:hypothetical protein
MLNETIEDLARRATTGFAGTNDSIAQLQRLATSASQHMATIASRHGERAHAAFESLARLQSELATAGFAKLADLGRDYMVDAWQRGVLTADVLRERGNVFATHAAAGAPPVLCYDYDVIVDGRDLKRPVNYMLLAIRPPEGVEVHAWKRPYMIIDPRAGHGPASAGSSPTARSASRFVAVTRSILSPFASIPSPARRSPT